MALEVRAQARSSVPTVEGRPLRVMLVVHALPPQEFSGTPVIAAQTATALARRGAEVAVLTARCDLPQTQGLLRSDDPAGWSRYEVGATPDRWQHWAMFDSIGGSPERDVQTRECLAAVREFRPDVVCVVDLVHLPSELPDVLAVEAPVVRYVWNAEDVCAFIEPVRGKDGPPCRGPLTPGTCAGCVSTNAGPADRQQSEELRVTVERVLEHKRSLQQRIYRSSYTTVLYPSQGFQRWFEGTMPVPRARSQVLVPGMSRLVAPPAPLPGVTTFLFLGPWTERKGAAVLRAVLADERLRERGDHAFVLYGTADGGVAEDPRVSLRGRYHPQDLGAVLAEGTVGLCPTNFETYHRVTREFLQAGRPVVGTHAFGIPDVVEHETNGLLVPTGDPVAFSDALLRLLDEPDLLPRLAAGARATHVPTDDDEVDALLGVLTRAVEERTRPVAGRRGGRRRSAAAQARR